MLDIKRYKLPMTFDIHDGVRSIERKREELLQKIRSGHSIDYEESDWLDWAEQTLDVV